MDHKIEQLFIEVSASGIGRQDTGYLVDKMDVLFFEVADGFPGFGAYIYLLGQVVIKFLFDDLYE